MPQIPASQIFKPSGYPDKSLIIRYPYFSQLLTLINNTSSRIIEISGGSRTGKSVMVEYCFRDKHLSPIRRINISGNSIMDIESFKLQLLSNLDPDNNDFQRKYSISTNLGLFSGGVESTSSTGSISIDVEIINKLCEKETALVIDDFHWIPNDVRKPIIRTLKAFMEQTESRGHSLKVIVVMIPTRDIHASNIWGEMSAERVKVFRIPLWEIDELRQIAAIKFAGVGGMAVGLRRLAQECYGLPSIMQSFCLEYCNLYHNGLVPNDRLIDFNDGNLISVFRTVASDAWHLNIGYIYDKLTSGKAVKDYKKYRRYDGKFGNINQLLLQSLSQKSINVQENNDPKFSTVIEYSLPSIIDRVMRIASPYNQSITPELIVENLSYMSKYIQSEYEELLKKDPNEAVDPILEFNTQKTNPTLTIYSPSFLMTLRYAPEVDNAWATV